MDDEDGHDEDFDDNELHDFGVGWDDRQDVDDRDDIDDGDDGDDGDEVRRRRRGKGKDKGKRKERGKNITWKGTARIDRLLDWLAAHPTEMRQLAGDSVKDAKAENRQKVTNSAPRSRIFKRIAEFLFSSDPDPHVVTDYNDHPTRVHQSSWYIRLRQRYRKACGEFRSTGNGILASDRLRGDQSLYDKIVREFPHFPKMDGLFNKIPNFNPIVGTSEPAQSLSSQFATTFMGKSSGGGDTLGGDHAGSVPFQTAGMMFSSDIPFSSDAALFFNDLGASSFGPPSAQQSGHNNFGDLSMIDIDDADMQRIFDTAMQSTIGGTDFQPPLDSTMQFDLQRTGPTSFVGGADSMFNMSPPTSFVSRPDMSLPSPASANPQRTGPTSFVGGADSMFNMSPLASFVSRPDMSLPSPASANPQRTGPMPSGAHSQCLTSNRSHSTPSLISSTSLGSSSASSMPSVTRQRDLSPARGRSKRQQSASSQRLANKPYLLSSSSSSKSIPESISALVSGAKDALKSYSDSNVNRVAVESRAVELAARDRVHQREAEKEQREAERKQREAERAERQQEREHEIELEKLEMRKEELGLEREQISLRREEIAFGHSQALLKMVESGVDLNVLLRAVRPSGGVDQLLPLNPPSQSLPTGSSSLASGSSSLAAGSSSFTSHNTGCASDFFVQDHLQ